MKLLFNKVDFSVFFAKKADFSIPPAFIFRSIIGYQLRKICCIAHDSMCVACLFHETCAYGFAFESIVPRNNETVAGRDRISHPVIIETEPFLPKEADALVVRLVFMGPAIKYLPYFFYALKKGGESGFGRERVPFKITGVSSGGRALFVDEETLDTGFENDVWEYTHEDKVVRRNLMVQTSSPLRFKVEGRYTPRFGAKDLALCLHRRARTLCLQYGSYAGIGSIATTKGFAENSSEADYQFSDKWNIIENNLVWRDFTHYSARQGKAMQLGGLMGSLILAGEFSAYEYAFLKFAEIFHVGKNTNFGLGKIAVWEKGGDD